MLVIAADEAQARPPFNGRDRNIDYIGKAATVHPGPQAFIVDFATPDARISPHFHDIDQFQVIVGGDGTIGKKELRPVTFQYADAFTPYGPIVARERGIRFFTLRNGSGTGLFGMPGSRDKMPGKAGRNIAALFDVSAPHDDAGAAVVREQLIERSSDGLQAVGLRLAPGAHSAGIETAGGGGQYYLVARGSVRVEGKTLPEQSLVWVDVGESAPAFEAGDQGADLLLLQFPASSERPGSDPVKAIAGHEGGYIIHAMGHRPE